MNRIRLRGRPGEIEIAVIVDDALADYALWRPGDPDGYGDVHLGRAGRRVQALAGCFVALGGDIVGFLPDREIATPPAEGAPLAVRVKRAALGGKGPRLAPAPLPDDAEPGGGPRLLARGPTPLEELRARFTDLPLVTDDPHLAATHGARLLRRARDEDAAVDDMIASLDEREVALPGGMRATIEPTAALVAIDLDSAAGTDAAGRRQTALHAANAVALPRLLHEVRLRNLSGAILIDAAGLAARKRAALAPAIRAALADDPLAPRLLGFSALGFAEIVRTRRRPALHELRASAAGAAIAAAAALAARQRETGAALALTAAPRVASAFARDAVLRADLARETGRPLILRSDPQAPGLAWSIEERGS